MRLHKFASTDAFVAIDLADAEIASGPVRWARRILQGGAKDLARSQTYTYAALGMRLGGASAGISAVAPDRDVAVAAFVDEAAALAADGTYLPDAAKGVNDADLAPLRVSDPRNIARLGGFASRCGALTAAAAAEVSIQGGLDSQRVVIEGLGAPGTVEAAALVAAIAERGGLIVGISTGTEALLLKDAAQNITSSLDADTVVDAFTSHGDSAVTALANDLGQELRPAHELWTQPAEVVFAGSKMGAVNHSIVDTLVETGACQVLVPCGRLAYTAKALAVCRRNNVATVPDFIALAGGTVAQWSDPAVSNDEVCFKAARTVSDLMSEALTHADGPFLGACYAAESFLSTWQDELPFGRPLAP